MPQSAVFHADVPLLRFSLATQPVLTDAVQVVAGGGAESGGGTTLYESRYVHTPLVAAGCADVAPPRTGAVGLPSAPVEHAASNTAAETATPKDNLMTPTSSRTSPDVVTFRHSG